MDVTSQPPTLWQEPGAAAGSNGTPRTTRPPRFAERDAVPTNFSEAPQTAMLTESLQPILGPAHPDGQYAIGHDSYIYFREARPPQAGQARLVLRPRRAALARRRLPPVLRPVARTRRPAGRRRTGFDRRPGQARRHAGNRQVLGVRAGHRAEYYAIYDPFRFTLEVFRLVGGRYLQPVAADGHGHFPVEPLGVALGRGRDGIGT